MWTLTSDVEAYAEVAEPFLLGDPVRNTVALTVLANLRAGMPVEDPRFGWWSVGDEVRGAVFHTPPHPVGLAAMPVEAVPPLVEALRDVPGVVGTMELTSEVTRLLGPPRRTIAQRLYRLGALSVPDAPGRGRPAAPADYPLLVSWWHAFDAETGGGTGDPADRVARRLAARELFVWESPEGVPVSLAALSPSCGGVCRIGPVYTPPSCRRRGYGAAVTAFASQSGLAERCEQVVLFADLSNPTSNAVYRSIGYEPVSDHAHISYA
ncbi:GNAT family N-acetyltransferase [Nonomuraea purpurea]|uniref:GNAT family N-acetyltransferase n=1 Tax=Nonomuraea purpurea TaxID=1849276 RepID=A0ABV8G5L0_9ACTN